MTRKGEIVRVARQLFETKGYERATMQEVMHALSIAKGTIYHYFKSKEELFEAVIEEIVDQSITNMEKIVDQLQGDALQKIEHLVKAGSVAEEHSTLLESLHHPSNAGMHSRLLAATIAKQAPLYAKLIRQGCDEKLFKSKNPLECAEMMLTALQFLTDSGIYPWSQEELKRRIEAFPNILEQLLNARPKSFQFLTTHMFS